MDDNVILLSDHRWIEVGSEEWQDEIMKALNEHTNRLIALEEEKKLIDVKSHPLFVKYGPSLYGERQDGRYIYFEPEDGGITVQIRQRKGDESSDLSDVLGEMHLLTVDALILGKYLLSLADWTPTLD